MSEYALGIHLDAAVVRAATATHVGDAGAPITETPPVLFVGGDSIVHGDAALAAAGDQPQGLIRDAVAQFTVDRIFLAGGQMLDPAAVMQHLLAGVVGDATQRHAAAPAAVTVACPAEWDAATVERISGIVAALGLRSPAVMAGGDVRAAAGDAATRLATQPDRVDTPGQELPSIPEWSRPPSEVSVQQDAERTDLTRPRRRLVALVAGVGLLAAGVGAVVALGGEDDVVAAPTTTTRPPSTMVVAETTVPTRALVLGVLGGDGARSQVLTGLVPVTAAGGVFGRPVELVVQPAVGDLASVVEMLRRQGVAGIVTDVGADAVPAVAGAAGNDLAVCSTTDVTTTSGTPILLADGATCAQAFALAALSAQTVDRASVAIAARELADPEAIACTDLPSCLAVLSGGNPISFQPPAGSLRLSSTS